MMWPDWKGESVAIVASGPSTKKAGVELLKGVVKVIAIKRSFELVPFADIVYGCDAPWWRSVQGLQNFTGLKLSYDADKLDPLWAVKKVDIPDKNSNVLLLGGVIGQIGAGGNSGFQAFNLAIQFGVRRVLLVGFDMGNRGGDHWYGRNNWGMANNPTPENYRRWVLSFNNASKQLVGLDIEVVNASSWSELQCFKKQSIEQTLRSWNQKE